MADRVKECVVSDAQGVRKSLEVVEQEVEQEAREVVSTGEGDLVSATWCEKVRCGTEC